MVTCYSAGTAPAGVTMCLPGQPWRRMDTDGLTKSVSLIIIIIFDVFVSSVNIRSRGLKKLDKI